MILKQHVISIVTVVYNAAETLDLTMSSVLNQTYKNIEYIIIDGGSTDGSLEIIKKYESRLSSFISEQDDGIYNAMNKGIDLANGDWIYFLGADDILFSPLIIQELVVKFKDLDGIYYGNAYLRNAHRMYNGQINKWSIALGNISHQAIFYPKSRFKNKKYDESYKLLADHIYNIELYKDYSNSFIYIPTIVAIYNDLGRSSINIDLKYEKNIISVIQKNLGFMCGLYVWTRRLLYSFQKNKKK